MRDGNYSGRHDHDLTDGTPEQIHLAWGEHPAHHVAVSWASPGASIDPRVQYGTAGGTTRTVRAEQRTYTDGLNGATVYTYHAELRGLEADTRYRYVVTSDNDKQARTPFAAHFTTAPGGRAPFRFTSYGDLSTPQTKWALSSSQSRFAVQAVERFEPLFHLLNGDLCYANMSPMHQPDVWRDYFNNVQTSAMNRPWMPCPGNHEVEFHNGPQGMSAYLASHCLPDNGTRFPGLWYSFQVGPVLFVSLDANEVAYQDSGAFVPGPRPLVPAAGTGNPPLPPGTSFYVRDYSQGEQTRWLEQTLRQAAEDDGIDWIIVQMHHDALSSVKKGNGSDLGLREAWLPLFDRYGVDLVLCGHDHNYERSYPVRGCHHFTGKDAATGAPVDTLQPRPVVTRDPADGRFDTRHGTIHLTLGGGGTSIATDIYGVNPANGKPQALVTTRPNRPRLGSQPGVFVRDDADAVEDAIWSARRDPGIGYGIAVFDFEPGEAGGKTTITMNYYHAPGADIRPTSHYELFETIVLEKPRRGQA